MNSAQLALCRDYTMCPAVGLSYLQSLRNNFSVIISGKRSETRFMQEILEGGRTIGDFPYNSLVLQLVL